MHGKITTSGRSPEKYFRLMPRHHTEFSRKHKTFGRLHSKLHIKITPNRIKWKPLEACFGFSKHQTSSA